MKHSSAILLLAVSLLIGLLLGCASQSAKAPPDPSPSLIQRPAPQPNDSTGEPAVQSKAQSSDEALLLDDSLDDMDNEEIYTVADPLEPFNRAMFYFNDKLYFWLFKPVATGYRTVTPQTLRVGLKNFFTNLLAPIRVVNNILQGDGNAAEAEFAKFVYNSTVGVLGFGNPSKSYPALNPDPEDLGQTLGSYGIGDGFYIVWPVLGASTLRDTIGYVGDRFLNPVSYVEPIEKYLTVRAVDIVNDVSFRLGDYETFKKAALDPYESMRNAYTQMRRSKIKK